MAHVFVIGGGMIGLTSGLSLLARGVQVTLIDDDTDGQAASWGNAGHIALEQVEPLASLDALISLPKRLYFGGGAASFPLPALPQWLPFGLRLIAASRPAKFAHGREALGDLMRQAMATWQRLVVTIKAEDLLLQNGHIVVWHDAKAAKAGRAAWLAAATGTASVADASAQDLRSISALCSSAPAAAVRFSGTGQIADLDRLRASLLKAFEACGGKRISATASLRRDGQRVELAGLATDKVLVCAGARSASLLAIAGHRVPMIAERGYHLRCNAPQWPQSMPPVVFEERSMIVTRYESALQLASFVEFNRFNAPPDPRKWERLERHAAELGLPVRGPFQRWMGSRPTLPDYLPAIGRSHHVDNLYYAFGHQHLGLTLGPITGELIAGIITDDRVSTSTAPFDIARFS